VVLVILALDNLQSATLKVPGLPDWNVPQIVIGLVFLAVGLVLGLLSAAPHYARVRFENGRLKRDLHSARNPSTTPTEPPVPPVM
jgi:lipopolysaccharide assembly protein A